MKKSIVIATGAIIGVTAATATVALVLKRRSASKTSSTLESTVADLQATSTTMGEVIKMTQELDAAATRLVESGKETDRQINELAESVKEIARMSGMTDEQIDAVLTTAATFEQSAAQPAAILKTKEDIDEFFQGSSASKVVELPTSTAKVTKTDELINLTVTLTKHDADVMAADAKLSEAYKTVARLAYEVNDLLAREDDGHTAAFSNALSKYNMAIDVATKSGLAKYMPASDAIFPVLKRKMSGMGDWAELVILESMAIEEMLSKGIPETILEEKFFIHEGTGMLLKEL